MDPINRESGVGLEFIVWLVKNLYKLWIID